MKNKFGHVLLIDDDEATNFMHEIIISKLKCADQIISFESANKALDYIQIKKNGQYPKPDLILLDINMPGMNGWEFLEEYEKLQACMQGKIIILMLAIVPDAQTLTKIDQYKKIDGYLIKPITPENFLEVIHIHFKEYLY